MQRNTVQTHDNSPIGVFDSGFGGLTVLKELIRRLPSESFVFVGDSARCPYGPRSLDEVKGFALQLSRYLADKGCKIVVIACNTATAAGLPAVQKELSIPVVGVVEPGSRAAVHMTRNRHVGVIATEGTISSGVYERAIHNIDAGIEVSSVPTPKLVTLAESGLKDSFIDGDGMGSAKDVLAKYPKEAIDITKEYLHPLIAQGIDTLVLGCTHFPLIQPLISEVVGSSVNLVSSAEETARDVAMILERRGALANGEGDIENEFYTTSKDVVPFNEFGAMVLNEETIDSKHLELSEN